MVRGKLTTVLVEAARLVEQGVRRLYLCVESLNCFLEDVPELLVENMHYILEFIFMKKISDTEVADIMNFITQQLNNHSNKDTRRYLSSPLLIFSFLLSTPQGHRARSAKLSAEKPFEVAFFKEKRRGAPVFLEARLP
jgi:hypothetical protein